MKNILILLCFLFISLRLFPQQGVLKKNDSLLSFYNKQIKAATHDSIIVSSYNKLAEAFEYVDKKRYREYLENMNSICSKNLTKELSPQEKYFFLKYKSGSINNIGVIYYENGNYDSALNYYYESLSIKEGINYKVSGTLINIGNVLFDKGDYKSAIKYYYRAISASEISNNKRDKASALNSIGNIFVNQGDYSRGIEYFENSIKIMEDLKDKEGVATILNNIAYIYFQLEKYEKSKEYFERTLKIGREINKQEIIASALNGIAIYYTQINNYTKSLEYYNECKKIYIEMDFPPDIAMTEANIGRTYHEMGDYKKSIEYGNRALKLVNEIGDIITEKEILNTLSESYSAIKDYKTAMDMYKKHIVLRDSILKEESKIDVLKQENKYQTEKKEQEIALKNKDIEILEKDKKTKNYLLLGLGVILLMGSGIGLLSYRNYKQKQKQVELKNIALEQKLLRLQMNPHFIFNSLSSISGQMLHNLNAARDYLAKFARLMRLILENSREAYVTMKSEVDALNYYMILEQQRFKDKFDFKIDMDSQLSIEETEIPPMLIQPHIENAILHGIVPKEEKGMIYVRFIKENETSIRCEIEDNGIGRKKSGEKKLAKDYATHKSLALEITRERLETLSEETHQTLSFKIEDLEDENQEAKGTKVILVLPCKTI